MSWLVQQGSCSSIGTWMRLFVREAGFIGSALVRLISIVFDCELINFDAHLCRADNERPRRAPGAIPGDIRA